jgi:predicted thioesterase
MRLRKCETCGYGLVKEVSMPELQPGLIGEKELVVTEVNTAKHLGSGDVFVLATPEMIRLMENASVIAVDHLLPEGQHTVGVTVDVKHLAATPLGMKVHARSELVSVEGRWLIFRVEAFDEVEKIGEGTHRRAIIEMTKFLEGVTRKSRRSL